jgi:hypothetical protein
MGRGGDPLRQFDEEEEEADLVEAEEEADLDEEDDNLRASDGDVGVVGRVVGGAGEVSEETLGSGLHSLITLLE